MNKWRVVITLVLSVTILSGCGSNKIDLPENEFDLLYVQGVDQDGTVRSGTKKEITDTDKIHVFMESVDSIEVSEQQTNKLKQMSRKLNEMGNYIIVLSETDKRKEETYNINMFEDGTFMYQATDENKMNYVSTEKHPELYETIEDLLEISF